MRAKSASSPLALRGFPFALLAAIAVFFLAAASASAQDAPGLTLSHAPRIAPNTAPGILAVEAQTDNLWNAARLSVTIRGPGDPSPTADPSTWPIAAEIRQELQTVGPGVNLEVPLSAESFARPGAYWAFAALTGEGDRRLEGEAWVGLIPGGITVDLATVWPVASGIHRDPEGVFVDEVLTEAVRPDAEAAGSLYALFRAVDDFPSWHQTLAIEPVLLTQLMEMADGFSQRSSAGGEIAVDEGEGAAAAADQALSLMRTVAALDNVQILPAPYAMPSLPFLGSQGWIDGRQQMQLGKRQVQEVLALPQTLDAAYPPGLELTDESLGFLSNASIDYAVASAEVAGGLAEPSSVLGAPVRVRDRQGNRLTLVFADPRLRAALVPPWDAGRFLAVLASVVTETGGGPIVAVPSSDYARPPAEFLEVVGEALGASGQIRSVTLDELLAFRPPSSRPVFLNRFAGALEGFVGQTYAERLQRTRLLVDDLAQAGKSERSPLESLNLLLFDAESRYWFAAGENPLVVNLGLTYLDRAAELTREEFEKVDVEGDKSVIVMGSSGEVPIAIINQTGYPLEARLVLRGEGLEVSGDTSRLVSLGPQENIITVPMEVTGSTGRLHVEVFLGQTRVDQDTIEVRGFSLLPILPWILISVAVLAVIVFAVLRLR